jgi:CheY-like chemotaxis protein
MIVERPIHTVLLVDDNPDDCEMIREAWEEGPIGESLRIVYDGTELLDYLYRRGAYVSREGAPRPSLILLDLHMPHMTGEEVLVEIKKDSALSSIPIVVLTTSKAPKSIFQAAGLGVNGYMQKPNSYAGYIHMLANVREHWSDILTRPIFGNGEDRGGTLAWC